MEDRKPAMGILKENEPSTSQAEFPPGMAPKMLKLVKVLNELEEKMEPLISKQHHEVLSKLQPLERAKVGLMEVYTINSLFWALMRTSGESIDSTLRDDYKVEMGRVKETQSRIVELESRSQRRRMDTEVASRFIHHGLGINRRGNQVEDEESQQPELYVMPTKQKRKGPSWTPQSRNHDYQDVADDGRGYQNVADDGSGYQDVVDDGNRYQDDVDGGNGYQDVVDDGSGYQDVVDDGNGYQDVVDDGNGYQDVVDDDNGYQDQDEELPQPMPPVKNKKKKKKNTGNSMLQHSDRDYQEASYDNSGYQGSGEDSFLPTPPNKLRKEINNVVKLQSSDENDIPSTSNGKLKKKKSKIPPSCNASSDVLPSKKLKKKKGQSNGNSYGYQNTGEECEVVPCKGKKKRKIEDEASTYHQSNEDSNPDLIQDDQVATPVSQKKQKKKKNKQEGNTSQFDISALLDTARGRINYQIEDDRDLSNKGRSWYEQGWT